MYFLNNIHATKYCNNIKGTPKVSIHLAICNEPPEIVLKTIENVQNLTYQNYELLVISNNTHDKKLWKPIEKKILALDSRYKFVHFEILSGFKAGALNMALKFTAKDADYILTLDSDYTVEKEALNIAIGTIQQNALDLLQFPQAYRNTSVETNGVEINYKHYFDCYLSSSKSRIMALPTGTLTMIDANIFRNGMQWPTDSITEDASFGVELLENQLKVGFCNKVIGRGTMPTESKDYSSQYRRWVFGNFQVLAKVWSSHKISFQNKIHLSTLLTAWLNLLGFVFVVFLLALPLLFLGHATGALIFNIGIIGVLAHCAFQLYIFKRISGKNNLDGWNGFLIHLGLLEIGAFYWMHYFIKKDKPFIRTSKFLQSVSNTNRFYLFPAVLLCLSAICFSISYIGIALFFLCFALQLLYAKFHKDQEIVWSKFNLYKLSK